MDLLSQRYASPFLILDVYIEQNRFDEFITDIFRIVNEENEEKTMWEYYLHRLITSDMSYSDFKNYINDSLSTQKLNKQFDFAATIEQSISILNNCVEKG